MAHPTIRASFGDSSYDIHVGDGILDDLPSKLSESCPASSYVVISDTTVSAILGERITSRIAELAACRTLTFPPGESRKTRDTWATLTDELIAGGAGRDTAIVAVGGGVVGDVAGFVAATYLRGVSYVQVPTTLLAMVDSSVGGKTGVDTADAKNLIGAFHQPRLVVADVATLSSLPSHHLLSGVAEALKHGAIADADYFNSILRQQQEIVEGNAAAMVELIRRSVEIKAMIVSGDEREAGRRAVLNFGHTVGHALEAATEYQMSHGEAVAIGMVLEAELGAQLGLTDATTAAEIRSALELFNLPTTPPPPSPSDADRLVAAMLHDKKARRGRIRFTLLERLGTIARAEDGGWTHAVNENAIKRAIE